MWARLSDITIPLGAKLPTIPDIFAEVTRRKKISGSKKVKFWLGAPRPQIWDRGPLT